MKTTIPETIADYDRTRIVERPDGFYWRPRGAAFKQVGIQAAAGVPLMCGEGDDFSSFRIGLFGLDKLADVDGTVGRLEARLDQLGP